MQGHFPMVCQSAAWNQNDEDNRKNNLLEPCLTRSAARSGHLYVHAFVVLVLMRGEPSGRPVVQFLCGAGQDQGGGKLKPIHSRFEHVQPNDAAARPCCRFNTLERIQTHLALPRA